ncbi:Crp/Fnr family transcriptional regulator [Sphaerisporangium album]|uniref:Crp/Fnr family transcriptional regulator n=1 Tax=Sphaerisporangium album TaxID=509200 RepID=A0A367FBI8_9ACTN|nr:Crp/Fnr family transcriptional regulator [Sphaerisporangium album]RCG27057.1 Crp/Fnr family transcriptional regulator [Sphaerisporangium album]
MTSVEVAQFKDELQAFIARDSLSASSIRFPKRTHIYNCGERDANIYLIESGQVKTQTYTRCGKECLLSIFTAGDIFGETSLLGPERTETATVMRTSWIRRIPATGFRAAMADTRLLNGFIDHLARRLSEQQQVITTMVTMDSEQRLAAVLLRLSRKLGKRRANNLLAIEERITQEELSGMVGTTRSRVGYFLKRFRDAGLVLPVSEPFLLVNEKRLAEYVDVEGIES